MRVRPVLLVVAMACLCGGTVQAAQQPVSPERLVLREPDVPQSLGPSKAGFLTNADEAVDYGRSASMLAKRGRITGYFTFFDRPMQGDPPQPGIWTLDDQVDSYRAVLGAHWGYQLLVHLEQNGSKQTKIPTIGDEHWATTVHWKTSPAQYVHVLIFRRAAFAVFVETVYRYHSGLSQTIALAQKIDRRIQAATRR